MVEETKSVKQGSEVPQNVVLRSMNFEIDKNLWIKFRVYCIQHSITAKGFFVQAIKEKTNQKEGEI